MLTSMQITMSSPPTSSRASTPASTSDTVNVAGWQVGENGKNGKNRGSPLGKGGAATGSSNGHAVYLTDTPTLSTKSLLYLKVAESKKLEMDDYLMGGHGGG